MNTSKYAEYTKLVNELSAEISHYQAVSPDTAYRERFKLEALRRAQKAAEEDKVFLGGEAKGVLIVSISSLGKEKADRFIDACAGWKSHVNSILCLLDGELGEIRHNKSGTCWVIDLASSRRTVMFAWISGPREVRFAGPRLNTTNGGAHWCGVTSQGVVISEEKSPKTLEFLARAMACWNEHKMTLMQWNASENRRLQVENERREKVVQAAIKAGELDGVVVRRSCGCNPTLGGEYITMAEEIAGSTGLVPEDLADQIHTKFVAKKRAEEDACIMAELLAEQTRLAEENAKAEAEAKRRSDAEITCKAIGISFQQWEGMTEKQKRLALHRARLQGKIS